MLDGIEIMQSVRHIYGLQEHSFVVLYGSMVYTPTTLLLSADFLLVATRIELIYMHTTVHVQSPLAAAAWPALPSRKLYQAKHQRTLQC